MRTRSGRFLAVFGAGALTLTSLAAEQTTPQPGRGAAPAAPAAPAGGFVPRAQAPPLPPLPQTYQTDKHRIRVVSVASGLANPWSLVFLPGGDILVTERAGRLRIIRKGVLDPQAIGGTPTVRVTALGGLLDVALHPKFAENQLVYLSYTKADDQNLTTTALARGRFTGTAIEG